MNDVGVAQTAQEQRPVGELRGERPRELHARRMAKDAGRSRVDGNEGRFDLRIVGPGVQEPAGLHGLPAEDLHRRSHNRDSQSGSRRHHRRSRLPVSRMAALQSSGPALPPVCLRCTSDQCYVIHSCLARDAVRDRNSAVSGYVHCHQMFRRF